MKKFIFKYKLASTDFQRLELPKDAQILTVQSQNNNPCIWALVDPNNDKEERCFEIFGTGQEINYDMGTDRNYIGTFQLYDGDLVFHVFEYTGV